jgi:hypothetical protein
MTALSLIRSRNAKWRRRSATSASRVCETVAILTRRGVGDDSAASFEMIIASQRKSGRPHRSQQPAATRSACVLRTTNYSCLNT